MPNTLLSMCTLWQIIFLIYFVFVKIFQKFHKSVSLDPDQAQRFVRPYLSTNYLQRFSVDNTRRKELKMSMIRKYHIQLTNPQPPWEDLSKATSYRYYGYLHGAHHSRNEVIDALELSLSKVCTHPCGLPMSL